MTSQPPLAVPRRAVCSALCNEDVCAERPLSSCISLGTPEWTLVTSSAEVTLLTNHVATNIEHLFDIMVGGYHKWEVGDDRHRYL